HYARAEPEDIVVADGARVTPPCPHYAGNRCAGCQLQHLEYETQLAAKRRIVGDALRRIGALDTPDPDIMGARSPWRYRTTITLAARRARGAAGERTVGLHPYDRPTAVFPLADCHIADPRLMALWREVRQRLMLLPERLTRLTLRLDREGRRHVIAESPGEPWRSADALRAALSDGDGPGAICWWQPVDGAARVVAGPATGFPPTAFEHVNPEMGAVARSWAVDGLGAVGGRVAWDLYGGIGDTAALLAARGASVVSVDADEQAMAWARTRAIDPPPRFVTGRAEELLTLLPEPQAVVVAPPRGGLHWNVTLRLTGQPVPRLAYLSSDPATLARDLRRLNVAYRVAGVRAFDLFPQTAQVAAVALLEAA
ncbi:MAG: class I SAM-dependent RNA methyltransferase, partial [Gemmatimonadales bacterium]